MTDGRINADALKASVDIVDIIGARVVLKRAGKDYRGLCPFHDDSHPSMDVVPDKQMYHCKSCGAGGDVIDFLMKLDGSTFPEAAAQLGAPGPRLTEEPSRVNGKHHAPRGTKPERTPEIPPAGTPPPSFQGAVAHWCYRDADARPMFYILRKDKAEKDSAGKPRKDFYPQTWAPADGWQPQGWPAPRPLYGLERLATAPANAAVILVAGEKCADAGADLFPPERVVMTWPGGEGAVDKADLSSLQGRKVFIWPDADEAGSKCRDALIAALEGIASELWLFNVSDMPIKWDVADAVESGWDFGRVQTWRHDTVQGGKRLTRHIYPEKQAAAIAPLTEPEDAKERATLATKADIEMSARHWKTAPWRHHLIFGGKEGEQVPIKCVANCVTPFRHDAKWAGLLRWDEMAATVRCTRPLPWGEQPDEWGDQHDTGAAEWLDRTGMHYSSGLVSDAIRRIAHESPFHPVREYLGNLKWDGTERVDHWLTTYCGAKNDLYTRSVAKSTLVSAAARAIHPGVRVKSMMILIGPQDIGKSEVFSILGGRWFGPQHGIIGGDAQKAKEQCTKLWMIEMSELATIRDSSVETVKDFVSTSEDTYRPAYGRYVRTIPRCCIFVGTANSDEIFRDDTGNVRFWPIKITCEIDLAGLRRDRDQLWAEAVHMYGQGADWWISDPEVKALAAHEQDARMVQDEWVGTIGLWLNDPEQRMRTWFRLAEVMHKALGLEPGRQNKADQRRAGSCMRRLGFDNSPRVGSLDDGDLAGKQFKVWKRPGSEED